MRHKHQVTDTKALKRLVESGISVQDVAEKFGVQSATVRGWLKTDVAPYWTRCAVEALERLRGKNSKHLFVGELSSAEAFAAVETVITSLGGDIHLRLSR